MTEPNNTLVGDYETITLAGKDWPIPLLAPRQNRIVIPKAMELMSLIQHARGAAAGSVEVVFNTEQYDMLIDVVYTALTRAHPTMTRDEFLDLPTTTNELAVSLQVIARQSGFIRPAHPGESAAGHPRTGMN